MDWTVRNKKHVPTLIPPISRESLYAMAAQKMYGKLDTERCVHSRNSWIYPLAER